MPPAFKLVIPRALQSAKRCLYELDRADFKQNLRSRQRYEVDNNLPRLLMHRRLQRRRQNHCPNTRTACSCNDIFGLRVGALTPLPECVIDPPDGPYHEQPVMPCFVSLEPVFGFNGRKIKWAPDYPVKITILFHPEQVPVGLDSRADGIIQSGRLAEVALRQSTHSPPRVHGDVHSSAPEKVRAYFRIHL